MPLVWCPRCDEVERLRGQQRGARRVVECGACGHEWERDLTPTCTVCGSRDLAVVPTSTLQEAGRGEQRTPSGIRDVYRCWSCGAKDATSSAATADPEWLEQRRTPVTRAGTRTAPAASRSGSATSRRVDSAFGTFEVGEVLGGRWRLARLLTRSSTGSSWLANDVDGCGSVVFKLLDPDETDDPKRRKIYVSSARASQKVEHPRLLRVLGVRQHAGEVLIVVRAAGKHTLSEVLGQVSDPARIGADVADALATMHARGLAHLRVRPDNIWIAEDGAGRLADFGTGRARARLRTRQSSDMDLTWLAPEQLVSHQHGPAADVYSLALVLWVALGGDLTGLGANPAAQATARIDADLPAPGDRVRAREPELYAAIEEAGRRDPSSRPSAEEFVHALAGP